MQVNYQIIQPSCQKTASRLKIKITTVNRKSLNLILDLDKTLLIDYLHFKKKLLSELLKNN